MQLHYSLKKIGVIYASVVAVLIFVAATIVLYQVRNYIYERQIDEIDRSLDSKIQVITRRVRFYNRIAQKLASQTAVRDILLAGDAEQAERWSRTSREQIPDAVGVTLFSPERGILGRPAAQNIGPACIADLGKLVNGVSVPKPPIHNNDPGLAHFDLTAEIKRFDETLGILFISISTQTLKRAVDDITGAGEEIVLHTAHGDVIYRSGVNISSANTPIVFHKPVPETAWQIEYSTEPPDLGRVYVTFGAAALATAVIAAILAIFLTSWMVRVISREMRTIRYLLGQLARGIAPEHKQQVKITEMNEMIGAIHQIANTIHSNQLQLKEYSFTDELTELPNRRHFQTVLSQATNMAHRGMHVCVGLLDIDHFKAVNDSHGHSAGDGVLQSLARTLKEHMRRSDFCARLGGDEFAVILFDIDRDGVRDWFERVRKSFEASRPDAIMPLSEWSLTISCGYAFVDGVLDMEGEQVLRKADVALYKAKELGRNRVEEFQPVLPAD